MTPKVCTHARKVHRRGSNGRRRDEAVARHVNIERDLLTRTYAAFNARDVDAVLAVMHPDVDWPNGMEGGRVHGHAGMRDYWTRQWGMLDPHVEPRRFTTDDAGRVVVDVHRAWRSTSDSGGRAHAANSVRRSSVGH